MKNDIKFRLERHNENLLISSIKKQHGITFKFTGEKGVPDRMIIKPAELFEPAVISFAEVKADGEEPDALQKVQIARLRKAGVRVDVIDSAKKAREYKL